MIMTEASRRNWLADPQTPLDILSSVLDERTMLDWPLPTYLLEDLEDLSRTDNPSQVDIDEARIPLLNWFRQQREELGNATATSADVDSESGDVMGDVIL